MFILVRSGSWSGLAVPTLWCGSVCHPCWKHSDRLSSVPKMLVFQTPVSILVNVTSSLHTSLNCSNGRGRPAGWDLAARPPYKGSVKLRLSSIRWTCPRHRRSCYLCSAMKYQRIRRRPRRWKLSICFSYPLVVRGSAAR